MKATFNNIVQKNFSMKAYLLVKYDGFWPVDMPTWEEIKEVNREYKSLHRNDPKKQMLLDKRNRLQSKYNGVMKEWNKLQ